MRLARKLALLSVVARVGPTLQRFRHTQSDRVTKLGDVLTNVAAMPEYRKFLQDQFAAENSFMDANKAMQYINDPVEA